MPLPSNTPHDEYSLSYADEAPRELLLTFAFVFPLHSLAKEESGSSSESCSPAFLKASLFRAISEKLPRAGGRLARKSKHVRLALLYSASVRHTGMTKMLTGMKIAFRSTFFRYRTHSPMPCHQPDSAFRSSPQPLHPLATISRLSIPVNPPSSLPLHHLQKTSHHIFVDPQYRLLSPTF